LGQAEGVAAQLRETDQQLPSDWLDRLRRQLRGTPEHELSHCFYGGPLAEVPQRLRAELAAALPEPLQAAAVLVPIVLHPDGPKLLLTVRASHLRHHAGQISFPGGRMEPADRDPAATALRETAEELGIAPALIEPLGYLTDHVVRTGFRITPVVGLLRAGFTLTLDQTEVAEAFEVPLDFALAATNYRSQRRTLREVELEVWELPYGEHVIWGATAGMLAQLRHVLHAAPGPDASGEVLG
jgi:8-oxo-dGTP pyrophosphatase MutT (NUDIX family)